MLEDEIFLIFCMCIEALNALLLAKTARLGKIWFTRYGVKRGSKRVKKGFFEILSKNLAMIWFLLLEKVDIISVHVCAEFQVQANLLSRDNGVRYGMKRGQNGSRWTFSTISGKVFICFFRFCVYL